MCHKLQFLLEVIFARGQERIPNASWQQTFCLLSQITDSMATVIRRGVWFM
jgi:hypothetical protein